MKCPTCSSRGLNHGRRLRRHDPVAHARFANKTLRAADIPSVLELEQIFSLPSVEPRPRKRLGLLAAAAIFAIAVIALL